MRERIIVLGATGSIGKQCLDILKFDFHYELVGVSLNSQYQNLEPYLFYFDSLKYVAIKDEKAAFEFKKLHPSYTVLSGENSSVELVKVADASVFNSISGNDGLLPSLTSIKLNKDLFLSNKESLVIGSSLILDALKDSKSKIYPVDSEHASLAKLLYEVSSLPKEDILSLTITASGGSLRDKKESELELVKPSEVLNHPTWAMGSKITIDSATMVNKGYEVIEASVLFSFPLEKIEAIICRESLVHALLTYKKDDQVFSLYEYAPCDMKVSIAYALSKGRLGMHKLSSEDEKNVKKLHFEKIKNTLYPCFSLTIEMFKKYGNAGMILYNAVDTCAIDSFLKGEIKFVDIHKALRYVFDHFEGERNLSVDNIASVISSSERYASDLISHLQEI